MGMPSPRRQIPAILILERGCVRSTSRSNERTRKCFGFTEMLRLVETTQSRSGAKMRIAARVAFLFDRLIAFS